MKNKVIDELKQHFRPEFLNRVDDTIVFPHLNRAGSPQIVDLEIAKLDKRLKDKDMGIELTPAAKDLLAKKGYDPVLGARPLRRTIQREIEDALSEKILYAEFLRASTSRSAPRARARRRSSPSPTWPTRTPRTGRPTTCRSFPRARPSTRRSGSTSPPVRRAGRPGLPRRGADRHGALTGTSADR